MIVLLGVLHLVLLVTVTFSTFMKCNCEFCFIGQLVIDLREKNNKLYVSEVTEINHNHLLEMLFMLRGSQIAQAILLAERWETVAMVPRGMMK